MKTHFVGWDVGGWNCDKNAKSRDAIVILDPHLEVVGTPWRGNLRATINEARDAPEFVARLYELCKAARSAAPVLLGIDTPLGFSTEFVRLTSQRAAVALIGRSGENPYLFRATERFLLDRGKTPLSPVKDMIGSQATKGMHMLARFAPKVVECGVWTDEKGLTAIEVYPASCKGSSCIEVLRRRYGRWRNNDIEDAMTCALIAHIFETRRDALFQPTPDVTADEGWIWAPKDGLLRLGPIGKDQ